jgi:membrane protease YdiL (CAAX protease family)
MAAGGAFADGPTLDTLKPLLLGFTVVFQFLVFLWLSSAVAKRWFASDVKGYMGYRRASPAGIAIGALLGVLAVPPVTEFAKFLDRAFPWLERFQGAESSLFSASSPLEWALLMFSIAVTPAICEEAIFRGILQRTLQRRWGFPASALVSGLIFSLFHQSPLGALPLFGIGFILGTLYWACDSIWPGMVMHGTYNALILAGSNGALPSGIASGDQGWEASLAGLSGLAVVLGVVIATMWKRRRAACAEAKVNDAAYRETRVGDQQSSEMTRAWVDKAAPAADSAMPTPRSSIDRADLSSDAQAQGGPIAESDAPQSETVQKDTPQSDVREPRAE